MAYVRIDRNKKCELYKGGGAGNNAFFYKEDILILLEQDGITGIQSLLAIINNKECTAIVGSKANDPNGSTDPMDKDGDILILSCPPYDHPQGGEELPLLE